MNAYTTMGQARIQASDIEAVLRANRFMVGASIAALERQRGWQAEAEVAWLLKQHGVTQQTSSAYVSRLQQRIGAALVRIGDRLLTRGLLMEIASTQRHDWTPQSPYPVKASDSPGGGRR